MKHDRGRRAAILGLGMAAGAAALGSKPAQAAKASDAWIAQGATTLKALHARLNAAPRRRDFKSVPMVLDDQNYWDHEALAELIGYRGSPKQIWDNKDLAGPWLNLMRNNLNVQTYSFKRPDFLIISATHASAHLAMYDQAMWDKYNLAKLAGLPSRPTGLSSNRKLHPPIRKITRTGKAHFRRTTIPFPRYSGAARFSLPATTPSGSKRTL
jgi:hypothetical protein